MSIFANGIPLQGSLQGKSASWRI